MSVGLKVAVANGLVIANKWLAAHNAELIDTNFLNSALACKSIALIVGKYINVGIIAP